MPGNEQNSSGLTAVRAIYGNRAKVAARLKEQGRSIVGYFCAYAPNEILTAAGMAPFRIIGDMHEPITEADAYLETIMCPYIRSCFDLGVKGRYRFLDGLLVPHTCDTVERMYNIWRYYLKPQYAQFVNIPHKVRPSSQRFLKGELERFIKKAETWIGEPISEGRLREAIDLHNENRALLRELYDLRKPDPPLISGGEVLQTMIAAMSLPVQESSDLVRSVITEVKARGSGPEQRDARVLVYGPELDDTAFIDLVEDCGANVVADDMCIGSRHFTTDVSVTADPLDGLASRYMEGIPCPRTYKEQPEVGGHPVDLENRFSYLKDMVREFNVNGVIVSVIRFCDTHEMDVPDLLEYLEKYDIPALYIEHDYSMNTIGQLKTRVQAFLEMIG